MQQFTLLFTQKFFFYRFYEVICEHDPWPCIPHRHERRSEILTLCRHRCDTPCLAPPPPHGPAGAAPTETTLWRDLHTSMHFRHLLNECNECNVRNESSVIIQSPVEASGLAVLRLVLLCSSSSFASCWFVSQLSSSPCRSMPSSGSTLTSSSRLSSAPAPSSHSMSSRCLSSGPSPWLLQGEESSFLIQTPPTTLGSLGNLLLTARTAESLPSISRNSKTLMSRGDHNSTWETQIY